MQDVELNGVSDPQCEQTMVISPGLVSADSETLRPVRRGDPHSWFTTFSIHFAETIV